MVSHKFIHDTAVPGCVGDLARFAEVGKFMNHVFSTSEDQRRLPVDAQDDFLPHDGDVPVSEMEHVDVLLGKASKAIEFLAARCEILDRNWRRRTLS